MNLQLIIAFFLIVHIRKSLQTATQFPVLNKKLLGTMVAVIAIQVVTLAYAGSAIVTTWLAHLVVLGLVGFIYLEDLFEPVRPAILAVLPLILVSFLGDLIKLINKGLYDDWDTLFEAATLFAVVYLITMTIINRKQKKALEKERSKTQEEERQNKIMAAMKAQLEVQVAERTAQLMSQKEALEHALSDLKSTQAQLILSEKLASLGELTAGIAHEIQNPLNFVNNFSEVNSELIEEMKHEIDNGNFPEVKAIANDIRENELKIVHHGKRAGAIVKGMLMHTRTSTGVKEPTNINDLADEYLRLAYHGLRAKDKSFNATMKTDFDESIGEINIIPQDIGRVLLNLITNAFYAAPLPPEGGFKNPQYIHKPTVWVSTMKAGDKVIITVRDNGAGIPADILDKIFQPFFTTKPTGQGTGLGLSLSYDIVKAHGGELNVITKENEGTSFIITLPI